MFFGWDSGENEFKIYHQQHLQNKMETNWNTQRMLSNQNKIVWNEEGKKILFDDKWRGNGLNKMCHSQRNKTERTKMQKKKQISVMNNFRNIIEMENNNKKKLCKTKSN